MDVVSVIGAIPVRAPQVRQRGAQRDPGRDQVELERRPEHLERQIGHVGPGLLLGQRSARDRHDVLDRQAARLGIGERAGDGVRIGQIERVGRHVVTLDGHAVERDDAIAALDAARSRAHCRALRRHP